MLRKQGRAFAPVLMVLGAVALAACVPVPSASAPAAAVESAAGPAASFSGEVVFDSDAPLPDDATVRIEIIDPALGEYPANVVAAQEILAGGGSSPLLFGFNVETSVLDPARSYVIGARVLANGATLYHSLADIPLTAGGASMEELEIPVGAVVEPSKFVGESAQSAGVVGGRVVWQGGEALPDGSELVIEIVETTNSGFGAPAFAATEMGVGGATSPVPFELQVSQPATATNYLIRAQVYQGDVMTWVSPGAQRWGTGDAPFTNFDLEIIPVEGSSAKVEATIPESAVLTGTLAYLQQAELPAGAVASVALVDLGVGSILASQVMTTTGEQIPLPFELTYQPAAIAAEGLYGLLAQISIDGVPTFATLAPVPVLTGGAPTTAVALILNLTTAAATEGTGDAMVAGSVTGEVTYRQRIALPAGAVVKVTLQDVSRMDAPATVLSTQVITTTGEQVPIPFNLPYDPAEIDERNTYAVAARIEIDGKLAWINDTRTPVITRDNPTSDVTVVVVQVK